MLNREFRSFFWRSIQRVAAWFAILEDLLDGLETEIKFHHGLTRELLIKIIDFIASQLERASGKPDDKPWVVH